MHRFWPRMPHLQSNSQSYRLVAGQLQSYLLGTPGELVGANEGVSLDETSVEVHAEFIF
jgi:hypothetical protein